MGWTKTVRSFLGLSARDAGQPKWRGVENLETRLLMATQLINNPGGPILGVAVGDQLDFQIWHTNAGPTRGQIYPSSIALTAPAPADAGFFIRIAGQAYGHMGGASGGTNAVNYAPVSNASLVAGNLTTVTTVANQPAAAAATPFTVTQTTTYSIGDEFFKQVNVVRNTGTAALTFDAFSAADIYLASSDQGFPFHNAVADAIGGEDTTRTYRIFNQPVASALAPTNFEEAGFDTIWTVIGSGAASHFDNTTDPAYIDNGAGHEWQSVTVAPGASVTISYFWAFGNLTSVDVAPVALPVPDSVAGAAIGPDLATVELAPNISPGGFSVLINWGDGSGLTAGSLQPIGSQPNGNALFGVSTANAPHIYRTPGTYTISYTLTTPPPGSGTVTGTTSIVVGDSTLIASDGLPFTASAGQQFTTNFGTVTDSNPWADGSKYVAFVDWGDGSTPTPATIAPATQESTNPVSGATFVLGGTHTYDAGSPIRTLAFAVFNKNTGERLEFNSTSATIRTQRLTVEGGHVDGGTVTVINADTGLVAMNITPFAGWTGDLNVATGDVTGDGIADFLMAPSVGGGPWLAIYDGATGLFQSQVALFDLAGRTGYTIAAGDTNGDGIADIVAAEETGSRVRLIGGQDHTVWWEFTPAGFYMNVQTQLVNGVAVTTATTPPDAINWNQPDPLANISSLLLYNGGINVAMSDVNGDGFADIIVAPRAAVAGAPGFFAAPVMYYDGRTSLLIHGTTPFGTMYTGGIQVAGGDITNDGHDDVLMMPDSTVAGAPAGTVFVHDIVGSSFHVVASLTGSALPPFGLSSTDYNLDGVKDFVLSGFTVNQARVVRVISGGSFLPIFTVT